MSTLAQTPEIAFQNVWSEKNQVLLDEIVDVWNQYNAIPPGENPLDRAKQVVYLARNKENHIVGISTAYINRISQLRANMFVYRAFIAKPYRRQGLLTRITLMTRDYLESIHQSINPRCLGIIATIENEGLNKTLRQAVYPISKLALIGYSKRGYPVRVYYFDEAKI